MLLNSLKLTFNLLETVAKSLLQKKFLGILFFGERVYIDIHNEPKNKITTKFTVKGRFCDSLYYYTKVKLGITYITANTTKPQIKNKAITIIYNLQHILKNTKNLFPLIK